MRRGRGRIEKIEIMSGSKRCRTVFIDDIELENIVHCLNGYNYTT